MSGAFDLLLAKENNGHDWIDLSIGEPKAIAELLNKIHPLGSFAFNTNDKMWDYPSPNGFGPLVSFLEDKYDSKIVITNGAKQGLAASFYAFKQKGFNTLGMRLPYWALIPPLAKHYGLDSVYVDPGEALKSGVDSYLALAPNNPDGFMPRQEVLWDIGDAGLPLIHDAAYYTSLYLPENVIPGPIGDLQIFSISKMYGLSGLRLGYIVCRNHTYYKDLLSYMETFTVGVSTVSQKILLDILEREKNYPELSNLFIKSGKKLLAQSRKLIKQIPKDIIELPDDYDDQIGMFAWVKLLKPEALEKANVKSIPGAVFGSPGMVRINLGLGPDVISEVVERLIQINLVKPQI